MLEHYKQLLTYIRSAVTKNYAEKSINSILDYVSTANDNSLLLEFYEITLDALKVRKQMRRWPILHALKLADGQKRASMVQNKHETRQTLF